MKKLLAILSILMIATPCSFAEHLDILPLMASKSKQQNKVWVGTFQLAWNDLMNEVVKGPVKFSGETPLLVKQLNKQPFKAEHLNEDSYYKTFGKTSPELKQEIELAIKEKFNETSDILDSLDWSEGAGKYTMYAMLRKNFKFLTAFDKLQPAKFARNKGNFEYFGINKNSDKILDSTVNVLFYNSPKDFAVSINTQSADVLYLHRTNKNKTLDDLYFDMIVKESRFNGVSEFQKDDELKIPNISLYGEKSFDELCNKNIRGTDITISQAIETIDFKMDNEGVKLKSEAAIATTMSILQPDKKIKPRKFYFDDTFVMFLQHSDENIPYFALRVKDLALINKTAR